MSGIVAFDDLFPLKADPTTLDRVFGFDSEDGKSRGFTIQSILDLIAETPVTWGEITGKPSTFAPAAHGWGSHTGVSPDVDTAPDGRLAKKIGGVWSPWIPDFLTSETDPTVPAWVKAITETEKANWNSAFGWGNHAGQYRPVAWVPTWAQVSDKPTTFAPAAHSLGSHSNVASAIDSATSGQLVRKGATQFEAWTPDFLTSEADPIFTAHPAYGITLGAIASWNEKLTEWAEFPNNTIPMIKDGAPVPSEITGVWSENPFDPETESEDYEAWVTELLHLISAKRIKGPDGEDADDYATLGQVPVLYDEDLEAIANATAHDGLNPFATMSDLFSRSVYDLLQNGATNGQAVVWSDANGRWEPGTVAGGTGGGHVIKSAGTPLTQRAGLNFSAQFTVSDDSGGDKTDVEIDENVMATRDYVNGGATTANAASRLYLFNNY